MVLLYNRSRLGAVERAALTAAAHLSLSRTQSHRTNLFFCLSILASNFALDQTNQYRLRRSPNWAATDFTKRRRCSSSLPLFFSSIRTAAQHLRVPFSCPSVLLLLTSASLFRVHPRRSSSYPLTIPHKQRTSR